MTSSQHEEPMPDRRIRCNLLRRKWSRRDRRRGAIDGAARRDWRKTESSARHRSWRSSACRVLLGIGKHRLQGDSICIGRASICCMPSITNARHRDVLCRNYWLSQQKRRFGHSKAEALPGSLFSRGYGLAAAVASEYEQVRE